MNRRLQVLFLIALLGVLAAIGTLLGALAGPWVAATYAVVVVGLLAAGARRARAAQAPLARACSCCTGTVHDPVQVR